MDRPERSDQGRSQGPTSDDRGPFFIVGMPRSGTSLVRDILNAHSQIAIPPETHFFDCYWKSFKAADAVMIQQRIAQFLGGTDIAEMNLPQAALDDLRAELSAVRKPAVGRILEAVLEAYAGQVGKPYYGEKTPDHLAFVPIIAEIFPRARFVCVLRDPRDVSLSLRQRPWNMGGVVTHALRWRHYCRLTERFSQQLSERFFAFRYEDLLSDPARSVAALLTFLELPLEAGLYETSHGTIDQADLARGSTGNPARVTIKSSNGLKWRQTMAADELKLVEILCSHELRRWGYHVVDQGWSIRLLSQVAWTFAKEPILRLRTARRRRLLYKGQQW